MSGGAPLWLAIASATHLAGACASVTVMALLWGQRGRYMGAGWAILLSLATSALWCLAVAVDGPVSLMGQGALGLRNLSYLWLIWRMFASDGRHTSVVQIGPVVLALALVDLLAPAVQMVEARINPALLGQLELYRLNIMLAMLGVVGALVLVHNLYASASQGGRALLRWPAMALGLVWVFELNLYTVAYLVKGWPQQLAALHGLFEVAYAVILAVGTVRGREAPRLLPSRTVAFQSVSLLVIGGYLLAMVGVAQWLAYVGGDYARWLQFGFLMLATAGAAMLLPSARLRRWVRVMLAKHLFQHRYDYRAEWLRFTRKMGAADGEAAPLYERSVQALADITDSPAGLLLLPDDQGDLQLAARWQWPTADVPPRPLPGEGASFLPHHEYIADLDELRSKAASTLPDWLRYEPRAWAVVPMAHNHRLIGAVVLARPSHGRQLDWEDFDLLRVVGQQLATYIAEHTGQQALAEAARFDDFHRRIAFVMHDIKNLASQFALLARNAERHAENPAFRADMLVTLRNSADRLNHLVARLSRYGAGQVDKVEPLDVGAIAREVAARFAPRHTVTVIEREPLRMAGHTHAIEQVLVHLVQNAVDASAPDAPVFIGISADGADGRIEIIDAGCGMSPDFLRTRLFRPFDSSKAGGFGIGAYEARELVRAMRGRMDVESREGVGTRFVIRLPLVVAQPAPGAGPTEQKVA